jgi:hypothetical protein
MLFEIGFAQESAIRREEFIDLVRDFAFVKNVASLIRKQLKSVRERRIPKDFSLRRRATVNRECLQECAWLRFQNRHAPIPIIGDQFGNRETFRGTFSRDSILWWAIKTYRRRRREYPPLLEEQAAAGKTIVIHASPAETEVWLADVASVSAPGSHFVEEEHRAQANASAPTANDPGQ